MSALDTFICQKAETLSYQIHTHQTSLQHSISSNQIDLSSMHMNQLQYYQGQLDLLTELGGLQGDLSRLETLNNLSSNSDMTPDEEVIVERRPVEDQYDYENITKEADENPFEKTGCACNNC